MYCRCDICGSNKLVINQGIVDSLYVDNTTLLSGVVTNRSAIRIARVLLLQDLTNINKNLVLTGIIPTPFNTRR